MSSNISAEKHDKCVEQAKKELFQSAVVAGGVFGGAWWVGGQVFATIAAAYYRAESSLIDCTQEYKERAARARARRQAQMAAEQAAAEKQE